MMVQSSSRRQLFPIRRPSPHQFKSNQNANLAYENKKEKSNPKKEISSSLPSKRTKQRFLNQSRSTICPLSKLQHKSSSQQLFFLNKKNDDSNSLKSSPFIHSYGSFPALPPVKMNNDQETEKNANINEEPAKTETTQVIQQISHHISGESNSIPNSILIDDQPVSPHVSENEQNSPNKSNDTNSKTDSILIEKKSPKEKLEENALTFLINEIENKLIFCWEIFDFTAKNADLDEIEAKERALIDLVCLFEQSSQIKNIDDGLKKKIFDMLEFNIFHHNRFQKMNFNDSSAVYHEPSWPHLGCCYRIMNAFIKLFPNIELININLIKRLFHFIELPDANERLQIVSLIRTYYDTHQNERLKIIKMAESILIDVFENQISLCASNSALVLLTYMFVISHKECPKEFYLIIKYSVVPLFGHKFLSAFQNGLKKFISAVLSVYPYISFDFLRGIELKWPISNGSKQSVVLDILILIFSKMTQAVFQPISKRVFRFLSGCILSNHLKTCELALNIWSDYDKKIWVSNNAATAVREMYQNVAFVAENHWNPQTVTKANFALNSMCKINEGLFEKVKKNCEHVNSKKFNDYTLKETHTAWIMIAKAAISNGESFNMKEKMKDFQDLFKSDKNCKSQEISRFIPVRKKDVDEARKIFKAKKA